MTQIFINKSNMKSFHSSIAIVLLLFITSTVCDVNIQDRRIRESKRLDDHRVVNAVDRRIDNGFEELKSERRSDKTEGMAEKGIEMRRIGDSLQENNRRNVETNRQTDDNRMDTRVDRNERIQSRRSDESRREGERRQNERRDSMGSDRRDDTRLERRESERRDDNRLERRESERRDDTRLERRESERRDDTRLERRESERRDDTRLERRESERRDDTRLERRESERRDDNRLERRESERRDDTRLERRESERRDDNQMERIRSTSSQESDERRRMTRIDERMVRKNDIKEAFDERIETNIWPKMDGLKGQELDLLSKCSALGIISMMAFLSLKQTHKGFDYSNYSKLIPI